MKRLLLVFLIGLIVSPVLLADPPAQSGFRVFRFEDGVNIAWAIADYNKGQHAIIGLDIREFCMGVVDFDVVFAQAVFLDQGQIVVNANGEARTEVFPFPQFDCDLFMNVDPLATGTSRVRYTDNDYNISGTRTNSFGIVAQGTLQSFDTGEDMRFNAVARNLWTETGEEWKSTHVNLH